jgi:predicted O-linked N-acetylglucosamine transferase (SPINDLY family)
VALQALGQQSEAVTDLKRAIAIMPDMAMAHSHLGVIYKGMGQFDDAINSCEQAIRLNPGLVTALDTLAFCLYRQGRINDAISTYRKALDLSAGSADIASDLGVVLLQAGLVEDAESSFRRAVELRQDHVVALTNLAGLLESKKQLNESLELRRQAVMCQPGVAAYHHNLGMTLIAAEKYDEAVDAFRKAIALYPALSDAHKNIGNALRLQGRPVEAVECYRQALALDPESTDTLHRLGDVLRRLRKLEEAEDFYRRCIALDPSLLSAYYNLGFVLSSRGKFEEAINAYRQVLVLDPNHALAYSNILMTLLYVNGLEPAEIFEEHKGFGRQFEEPLRDHWKAHGNSKDTNRRLKVGYVSSDFRDHSVARFIEPILANHDRAKIEVYCYYTYVVNDAVTERIKELADSWLECGAMSDDDLADRIREDGIDILVDLSGHTGMNRLLTFARKPAPVQVTWIGYPGTTGLQAMDYRFTDHLLDPPGLTDPYHTETLIRLPTSATFQPDPASPPVNELPALSKGQITLASLNGLIKLNNDVVALWARILKALPTASLMLGNVSDASVEKRLTDMFAKLGISAERLIMVPPLPIKDFLALHHQIDLALDPFPYGGGTTTNHSLWMGVPVVTLSGPTTASRHGVAIMTPVGLSEFVTATEDEYINCVLNHARDLHRLNAIRQSLRERSSENCGDGAAGLTHSLEQAYQTMWQKWCRTPRTPPC